MRKYVLMALGGASLILGGWLYCNYSSPPPPAPRDLTTIFPAKLLAKATVAQLAVLRGETTFALKTAPALAFGAAAADIAAAAAAPVDVSTEPGLKLTLDATDGSTLDATYANSSDALIRWSYPAGTLFSNGAGNVILLRDIAVEVPAKTTGASSLAIAPTRSADGVLTGHFKPHNGSFAELQPLLKRIARDGTLPSAVVQTAVLAVCEDVSVEAVARVPRGLLPPSAVHSDPQPYHVANTDIMAALFLLRQAGIDTSKLALASRPQLKILAMLDPDTHAAAKEFFGITDETEWSYWQQQLLKGDPSLRHYALYGIARYYPDVAIKMMPHWVRGERVSRNFRVSAAWALALIDDRRARMELSGLRMELDNDAAIRDALDAALRHWHSLSATVAMNTAR